MKSILACVVLLFALLQTVSASVFSQLQFIKIVSPASGATLRAGEDLEVKYTMQPLVMSK